MALVVTVHPLASRLALKGIMQRPLKQAHNLLQHHTLPFQVHRVQGQCAACRALCAHRYRISSQGQCMARVLQARHHQRQQNGAPAGRRAGSLAQAAPGRRRGRACSSRRARAPSRRCTRRPPTAPRPCAAWPARSLPRPAQGEPSGYASTWSCLKIGSGWGLACALTAAPCAGQASRRSINLVTPQRADAHPRALCPAPPAWQQAARTVPCS
jgi:hypothetical protein